MKELAPGMLNIETILNALKDDKKYLTTELHKKLKCPENYTPTVLGQRLNPLKNKGLVANQDPTRPVGRGAKKEWFITQEGKNYLKSNMYMVQDPEQYDLTYFSGAGKKTAPPPEPSVPEQEQMFSETANAAMDEIGELVGLSTQIETVLYNMAEEIDHLDKEFDLDNALDKLGLDDKTLTKLSSIALFKNIVQLANDVKLKVKAIKKLRENVGALMDEQD